MRLRPRLFAITLAVLASLRPAFATAPASPGASEEPLVSAMCRLIDSSARAQGLPLVFLTRLIWQESRFESRVVSPAGALGIAQFMPGTAGDRGLKDPFDPEAAIPKAASLLADLKTQFGNLGLAAAAYNAGPTRLANFLGKAGDLPLETRDYVLIVTKHAVEDWIGAPAAKLSEDQVFPDKSCVQEVNAMSAEHPALIAASPLSAPWGVQIAGSFSKAIALRDYVRARASYAALLGDLDPMILGSRLRYRGSRTFYRVRAPEPSRQAAELLCRSLLKAGGACVVLRS